MVGKTFAELIKDQDNAKLAEEANDLLGLGTPETDIPMQSGLTYKEAGAHFNAPVPENYDQMVQEEIAEVPANTNRSPAVDANPFAKGVKFDGAPEDSTSSAGSDDPQTKLERLLEERKKAYEDAQSRQWKADLIAGLAPHLSQMFAGATAMNTKANVQNPQMAPIKVGDFTSKVDAKYKPELDVLMKEYEALKKAKEPMSEYQRQYLALMNKQYNLGVRRADDGMYKFEKGDARLWDKQNFMKEEKNELSDKQTAEAIDFENTLEGINSVINRAEKFKDKLGPNVADYEKAKEGRLGAIVPGSIDPEFIKFRADAKALKGAYQKMLSGLNLTEAEMREMQSYVPHEGMPYKSFMANAKAFEDRVKMYRRNAQHAQSKYQGKNVGGKAPKGEVEFGQTEVDVPQTKTVNGVQYVKVPGGWQKVK
jgi:hypothetical protein